MVADRVLDRPRDACGRLVVEEPNSTGLIACLHFTLRSSSGLVVAFRFSASATKASATVANGIPPAVLKRLV